VADQFLYQAQEQRMQQILAPQLRQSLEFLQVPILELRTLVQQELQQNPTLEEQPTENMQVEVEPGTREEDKASDEAFQEEFKVLAKLDDEWREYFQQSQSIHRHTRDDEARRQFFLDSLSQPLSLQEHLINQLLLSSTSDENRKIGELLIGSINDDGYLTASLDELTATTGFEHERLAGVLALIQDFDPIGVAARDLRECLLIQLRRLGKEDALAAQVVRDHLDALGARKFAEIARALKTTPEEIQNAARFIATLEPKPGRMFASDSTAYVLPEVVIQKVNGNYVVVLNNDQIPHLRISKHYRTLMEDPGTSADVRNYIRDKIRAGAFLIKSIGQRQQTISRIAQEIVKAQRDFFDHGITRLRPLTMAQIAEVVGIHETTVSRAIANKYMQTPIGTFEMKYFFTPGFKTADGQEISNKTIKDAILQIISDEDPANPMSDQAMVDALQVRGIKVARRTIAKYRDELKILPSHLRKSY
jgi:RNA polymerase sigma-54 factor